MPPRPMFCFTLCYSKASYRNKINAFPPKELYVFFFLLPTLMFHLVTWQRFRKTGRPERSWHRFSNEFPCHWCRLTGCFSNTIRAGSKNKLELRAVHLISSPAGRPAPVPGPLNSGTSGRGPVFAGTPGRSAPSGSPPAPLKAPAFVRPRQMHYLHYSQAKAPRSICLGRSSFTCAHE